MAEYNGDMHRVEDGALSLDDLPIHGGGEPTRDYDRGYYYLEKEEQSFEFFSEEWMMENANYFPVPPESIIFCGNLIPLAREKTKTNKINGEKYSSISNHESLRSPRIALGNGSSRNNKGGKYYYYNGLTSRSPDIMARRGPKNHVLAKKVDAKSSWMFFYGFGFARVPVKMELSRTRNRRIRQISRWPSPSESGGDKVVMSGGGISGKGLWGFIRDLGCGGEHNGDTMVKASLVNIQSV